MRQPSRFLILRTLLFLRSGVTICILIWYAQPGIAQDSTIEKGQRYQGWSLSIDNDLLVGGDKDHDYTGGIAFGWSGSESKQKIYYLSKARSAVQRILGYNKLLKGETVLPLPSAEAGFVLFTPADINIAEPIANDHPYASVFFLVSSEQHVLPLKNISYQSSLTIGFLGLPLAEKVQSAIHGATGSEQPRGWDNQISAGGEPTFRYTAGFQKVLANYDWPKHLSTEIKFTSEANVGFTSDINAGVNLRFGRLLSPWWSFNPHQAEYVSLGVPISTGALSSEKEFFLYAGMSIRWRLYNAILQGQFRDSDVEFDYDQLESLVGEAWAGANYEFNTGLSVSAFVRHRSAELKFGGARSPLWGGFVLRKKY